MSKRKVCWGWAFVLLRGTQSKHCRSHCHKQRAATDGVLDPKPIQHKAKDTTVCMVGYSGVTSGLCGSSDGCSHMAGPEVPSLGAP